MMPTLTLNRLKDLLSYDPETGLFTCVKARQGVGYGHTCTSICDGYVVLMIDRKTYRAHRLAWFYMMGVFPKGQIDHKNMCRSDNRFNNLREATPRQNKANREKYKNNTSGAKGVFLCKRRHQWLTRVGKRHIGYFKDKADAITAYNLAASLEYGEYARS